MSEYLDKTGLSYFWGKVKEKLNNKANKSYVTNVVTNVKEQLEEQLNYKANRNQLNGKADLDRYQIRTVSTNKFKFDSIISGTSYSNSLYLYQPDKNHFAEPLPSGYTIECILAVKLVYFENATDYNNETENNTVAGNYNILPIQDLGNNDVEQTWNVFPSHTMNMYGAKIYYTLLVVKPQLPVE